MSSLPNPPGRQAGLGFLYIPPFRIQGISDAGEETCVQIPELDICFDIGRCPRPALASSFVALSHGHMDHVAGVAYYLSQRHFQGMGTGTIICPRPLAQPLHRLMDAWVDIENQRTPYKIIGLEHDEELEIKNRHFIRAFSTVHTVPSMGYTILERRNKLKAAFVGLPQEQILQHKRAGEEITENIEVPLICYTGDTKWGPHFDRDDVRNARILITECTFTEPGHRSRSEIGKHLHIDDIARLVEHARAESIVLIHLSRRTHVNQARKQISDAIADEHKSRVFILMDHRTNRARFEQQQLQETGGADRSPDEASDDDNDSDA